MELKDDFEENHMLFYDQISCMGEGVGNNLGVTTEIDDVIGDGDEYGENQAIKLPVDKYFFR